MVPSCGRCPRPPARSQQSAHLTHALSPLQSHQAGSQVSSAGVNCPGRMLGGLLGRATGLQLPGCTRTPFLTASTDIAANNRRTYSTIQSLCEEGGSPVVQFLRSKGECLRREVLPRPQSWLRGFGFLTLQRGESAASGRGIQPVGDAAFPGASPGWFADTKLSPPGMP